MNEIEKTRKELEDFKEKMETSRKPIENDKLYLYNINNAKLEGFNLGVQLTQKEFLEWTELLLKERKWKNSSYLLDKITNKNKELKQSLGEKTK